MDYDTYLDKLNIKKTCKTCEFNFKGICADAYYGEKITDYKSIRKCWSIDLKTYSKIYHELNVII